MLSDRIKIVFDKTVDIVFGIILLCMMLGIVLGTVQLFATIWALLPFNGITGQYINVITDVLTLYVLVELSRSLVDYFASHRLRLTFIVDAAIVFIIRELLIILFKHEFVADTLYAFSTLLFVLGALRIASIVVYQRERKINADINE